MKKILLLLMMVCFAIPAVANEDVETNQQNSNFQTTEEILSLAHDEHPTPCASQIFADALYANETDVSETDAEQVVHAWARDIIQSPEVLKKILEECPEVRDAKDDETIHFTPVVFKFSDNPDGRNLTITYSTQKKVLKQKLILATKRSLPNGDPNPKLMDENDPAIYINTDPAWYAIMLVQHDSLKDFVGEGKNNTLSLSYIKEHIKDIYPRGYHCTSKSALSWGNNYDTINKVVRKVVDLEKDSNDYYVAGDVNLEWIMYAEIFADIVLTVVTFGAGEAIMIGAKMARAAKAADNLLKTVKALSTTKDVIKYVGKSKQIIQQTKKIEQLSKTAKNAKKYNRALKNAEKARQAGKDASRYEKQAEKILKSTKKIDPDMTGDALKNVDKFKSQKKAAKKELKTMEKEAKEMEKASKEVKQFKEASETFSDLQKYRHELRSLKNLRKRPQTGNVLTRNLKKMNAARKTFKAANTGSKLMGKASRLGRKGMSSRSAKLKDWLFDASLKHGARLARVQRDTGLLYGAIVFLGEMYDKTSATNDEFTNGLDFRPLCLLSADDIKGQENVVNYGMWLMWEGNSTDVTDDDAAYLQVMDFAAKLYHELDEYQDNILENSMAPDLTKALGYLCNIDIFIVRPIIRLDESDPNENNGELFFLFMNDKPWTTAEQFGEMVPDIEDWERTQEQLEAEDPDYKYHKPDEDKDTNTTTNNNNTANTASPDATESASGARVSFASTFNPANYENAPVDNSVNCGKYKNSNIMQNASECGKLSGTEQSRCKKCISHAGTYENGRCFIEVLHWVCRDKGWPDGQNRSCAENYKYSNCGLINRYVDAEKPFTCPQDGVLSGCCQHGNSAGAKHPPMNVYGSKYSPMNCQLPLSSNTGWRVVHNNGSAIGLDGVQGTHRAWCMPNASSHPWNNQNQPGGRYTHCGKTIAGGTTLNYWHSLN